MDGPALSDAYATLKTGTLWHNTQLASPKHPCKGYADANPGEAAQIDAYVAKLAAGDTVTPPVLATATGRGLVGMLAAMAASTPTPPPPPPVSSGGKVFTGGDFDAFLASLKPGDTAAVRAGVSATWAAAINHGGTEAAPITVTSEDPAHPATIHGRLDMRGLGSWWIFDNLLFDHHPAAAGVSWVVGGSHNVFRRIDATNHNTGIGFHFIDSSTYGHAADNTIEQTRIHDVGRLPYGSTNNDHGVYDLSQRLHVVDVMIENCSDRGLQARGSKGGLFEQVTVSHCGEGVIFGDVGAVDATVRRSILVNNQVTGRYLIEEYDPSGNDSGNRVEDTFAFNSDGRNPVGGTRSVTFSNLHKTDPQLDASTLMPKTGSAAAGYGCRVALPRLAA